jgi:hypothetical protein
MRKLCKLCNERPQAINYHKNGVVYYRSKCDHCNSGRKKGRSPWELSGYKKKSICERCGYLSKYAEQFNVFHIDGHLTNCRYTNLKTVCANCQRILHREGAKWRQGDLIPDKI